MTSLELLEAMGSAQDEYILAAQGFRSSPARRHRRHLLLIAAVIAALLAGCSVAYLTLRDAKLGSYTRESSSLSPTDASGAESADVLSLQGFVGSAGYANRRGYALTDLDGDGQEELLVGIDGYFQFCYTIKDGAVKELLSYGGDLFYCSADGVLVRRTENALHVMQVHGGEIAAERHLYYSAESGTYEEDMGTYRISSSKEAWEQLLAEHPRIWLKAQPLESYPGIGTIDASSVSAYAKGLVLTGSGGFAQSYGEILSSFSIESYALVDVDGDEQEELLTYTSEGGAAFTLYTMSGGRPLYLAGSAVTDAAESILCQGGIVRTISRYPGGSLAYRFLRLLGGTLEPIDYLRYDADQGAWLQSTDASGQDNTLEPISIEAAQDILTNRCPPITIELHPAAEYSE